MPTDKQGMQLISAIGISSMLAIIVISIIGMITNNWHVVHIAFSIWLVVQLIGIKSMVSVWLK